MVFVARAYPTHGILRRFRKEKDIARDRRCHSAMRTTYLLHELVVSRAEQRPESTALTHQGSSFNYGALAESLRRFAGGLLKLGVARSERVGILLDKRFEFVVAAFGASAAGATFVPLNPLLKPEQIGYILRDCNVRVLVT